MEKLKDWLAIALVLVVVGLVVAGGIHWYRVSLELNRPERAAAWAQIKRERIRDFAYHETVSDPRAVKLWLATGRDPNGRDCAQWGHAPSAFDLAILRTLGLCNPRNADVMPFIRVSSSRSPQAVEAARLMIEAGVNVNEVSPDGIGPLSSAVLFENEEMVKLLLEAGADPLLRPKKSHIGDFRSALEIAEGLQKSPRASRIREAVRSAADRRNPDHSKK